MCKEDFRQQLLTIMTEESNKMISLNVDIKSALWLEQKRIMLSILPQTIGKEEDSIKIFNLSN